jgi:glucose/arabinose dehydrogenase
MLSMLPKRSLPLLAWLAAALVAPAAARAQALAYERVVEGLNPSAVFAFAPDGRIFVGELAGNVRVVENGVLLPAPFAHLDVNSIGERGLLGLALDPNFASNGWVYAYHSVETNPADLEGPKSGRLTRLTASGNVAVPGSATVLLGTVAGAPSCAEVPVGSDCVPIDSVSHMGGSLRFGPDGFLYLGTGDGIFSNVDAVRALRAQDLDVPAGKILRIRGSDGTAPSDNPFFSGDASANRSKVWAYGVRQPFRMGFHPWNGIPLVGDVGDTFHEEISFAEKGVNLGWPCWEGPMMSLRVPNEPLCQALYASPPANLRFPAFSYTHVGSASVTAGVFAPASAYPAPIAGRFVFGDYVQNEVRLLSFPSGGTPYAVLGATVAGPVDFQIGPDDKVYVLSIADGTIYRLVDVAQNVAPFAKASADPVAGLTPLDVAFSSAGSFDSNGEAITYEWDFGDGGTLTAANPVHTYETNGTYDATLTVRDVGGASDVETVRVLPGRQAPVATITTPLDGAIYGTGETLHFRATATDADDGPLPPSSVVWVVLLIHCEDAGGELNCHAHPLASQGGPSLDLAAPNHGTPGANEFYYVEARVRATDSDGLTTETRVRIGPDIDADRCMDLYAPFALATAPYTGDSDEVEANLGTSLAVATHAWNPNGIFSSSGIAASAPNGEAAAVGFAALFGPLTITESTDYAITFDAFLGGIVGVQPGPVQAEAELLGRGFVVDAATEAEIESATLFSHRLAGGVAGPVQRTPISQPNLKLPFVVRLDPGSYEWRFLTTATARSTSDGATTDFAAAASTVALREARICKQRLPDSALPQL